MSLRSATIVIFLGVTHVVWSACTLHGEAAKPQASPVERLRVIIETDAGGDPDDEQSLVRFLLYCNEWDVEGIIANRPKARDGENVNRVRDGLGIVRAMVDAYAVCYPNLVQHDPRYPTPDYLRARTVAGYNDTEAGVQLVLNAVDRRDTRPVWFLNWGTDDESGISCLKRALDRVLQERGADGYREFKQKLRLISYDIYGAHTNELAPAWPIWVHTFQPELDGNRWYHRFSGITAQAGGFDIERDVRHGHGPLGALYPTNTTHPQKEGDSMTFLYLVPTGMNDPNQPTWGSWAGRYSLREDQGGEPYYWASAEDAWNETKHRENTLARWAVDLQNDFRARMDWCVQPRNQANHAPTVVVEKLGGRSIITLTQPIGKELQLSASGTYDRDDHKLEYQWFHYREPSSSLVDIEIANSQSSKATLTLPATDTVGAHHHLVVVVRDNGDPPLASYRRVIITAAEPEPSTEATTAEEPEKKEAEPEKKDD